MKSEMDQLRENTEKQKAKDTIEGVFQYYMHTFDMRDEKRMWTLRSAILTLSVLSVSFAAIPILVLIFGEYTNADAYEYFPFVIFFCLLREHWHDRAWEYWDGQNRGVERTLKLLGWLDDEPPTLKKRKRQKRSQSYFQRYKELWERLKGTQEAYT